MADDYRLETHGLVLDPSQITAGQAAVTESQNWVSKRDGLIETRGGFESYISDLAIAASMPAGSTKRRSPPVSTSGRNPLRSLGKLRCPASDAAP